MSARLQGHFKVVTNASMGANISGTGVRVKNMSLFSIQAVWSGGSTPIGDLKIQVSNQVVQEPAQGGDMAQNVTQWDDYATQAVSGNSGSYTFNITNAGYTYARIVYARTSGSGTLNASFQGKTQ